MNVAGKGWVDRVAFLDGFAEAASDGAGENVVVEGYEAVGFDNDGDEAVVIDSDGAVDDINGLGVEGQHVAFGEEGFSFGDDGLGVTAVVGVGGEDHGAAGGDVHAVEDVGGLSELEVDSAKAGDFGAGGATDIVVYGLPLGGGVGFCQGGEECDSGEKKNRAN